MSPLSYFRRSVVAFPLAALAALAMFVISEVSYQDATSALDSLGERASARNRLNQVAKSLLDAETGQRGYLLSSRQEYLNPYVNFHRPCFFPTTFVDAKGKVSKRYPVEGMMTPYAKLRSLPNVAACLKPDITLPQLDNIAASMTDNEAALQLNQARTKLFQSIHRRSKRAA